MSNDRFKFRVWDKKNSEYVPEGEMSDVHCLLHRDGTLDCGVAYDDGYAGGVDWVETEDAVIEQCTGLTDKNGKLIYEGDILRATCTDGKHIDYPVGWWDGAFHLYYVDKSLIAETGTIQFCSRGLVSVKNCCYREIIGNIHDEQFRDATKMVEDKDND